MTVAEMAIATAPFDVGAKLSLGGVTKTSTCFAEMGGVVIEVSDESWDELAGVLAKHGVYHVELGRTQSEPALRVDLAEGSFSVALSELRVAHTGPLAGVLYG